MLILYESQDQYQPNIPRLDVSSMHCAGIVRDVVHSSQIHQDPCDFCPKDKKKGKKKGRKKGEEKKGEKKKGKKGWEKNKQK